VKRNVKKSETPGRRRDSSVNVPHPVSLSLPLSLSLFPSLFFSFFFVFFLHITVQSRRARGARVSNASSPVETRPADFNLEIQSRGGLRIEVSFFCPSYRGRGKMARACVVIKKGPISAVATGAQSACEPGRELRRWACTFAG